MKVGGKANSCLQSLHRRWHCWSHLVLVTDQWGNYCILVARRLRGFLWTVQLIPNLGVSLYAYHTVPFREYIISSHAGWFSTNSFRRMISIEKISLISFKVKNNFGFDFCSFRKKQKSTPRYLENTIQVLQMSCAPFWDWPQANACFGPQWPVTANWLLLTRSFVLWVLSVCMPGINSCFSYPESKADRVHILEPFT